MRRYIITEEQFAFLSEYGNKTGKLIFESEEIDTFDPFEYDFDTDTDTDKNKGVECFLSIQPSNAKIHHPFLSLPAGYTCRGARDCKSFANKETGKITDTPNTRFRCYAASEESRYKTARKSRWRNYDLLMDARTVDNMAKLIVDSINITYPHTHVFRIHESGDFFSQTYFDAWIKAAKDLPQIIFYAYTKMLPLWVRRLSEIPDNLKLNASKGGVYDRLIEQHNLKFAEVVFSVEEAIAKKLHIDKNDDLAWRQDNSFAILLHGTQPKGSEAAVALSTLKKQGYTGYSKKK